MNEEGQNEPLDVSNQLEAIKAIELLRLCNLAENVSQHIAHVLLVHELY